MVALTALRKHPVYSIYQLAWNAADWLFPPRCGGCGKIGVRWCEDCQQKTSPIRQDFCPTCGDFSPGSAVCSRCLSSPPMFRQVRSFSTFQGPLRNAIHRVKYQQDIGLTESLSRYLIDLYRQSGWQIDMITAVPLSPNRQRQRGFNQSALLAMPVGLAFKIRFDSQALKRNRETRSQVGLSAQQRMENVSEAFAASPAHVQGKNILVVDDVSTTGATLRECAAALRKSGAAEVFGMTLARAMIKDDLVPEIHDS